MTIEQQYKKVLDKLTFDYGDSYRNLDYWEYKLSRLEGYMA